eukprot:9468333-Pyramimonas_sp.AAC.1
MGNPRSWLTCVFVTTLSVLVLPTSSIEQCSICDDIELRQRCIKEFPGRKVRLRKLPSAIRRTP